LILLRQKSPNPYATSSGKKLGNGEIGKPIIHQVFDFKDVAKAHIEMDKGTHIGKVMLDFTLLNQ